MATKTILGLDLGTNSIGWALVEQDFESRSGSILGMGSRVIPMSQDILGEFGKGNSVSQTAERTRYRSTRRLRARHLLRRERLHRVLRILGFLPDHYIAEIDFDKRLGQFHDKKEPKIPYRPVWNEQKQKKENEFIFTKSFGKMLADFREHQPGLLVSEKRNDRLVPYDWTIYYLRKKALTEKIEKEELAWLILHFNQKRGYYQLRGEEEEENPNKLVEFHSLQVTEVIADEAQKNKSDIWYSLHLENGWVYRRSSRIPLFDWKGKVRDFIVTTDLNDDGSIKKDKEGNDKRSFRAPGEDDWTLLKKKTESEIEKSGKTVGAYIYDTLLKIPGQKVKGKLVRTIERRFYKEELRQILSRQAEFHSELRSDELYHDCVRELYRNNVEHQQLLSKKDFVHLFLQDIVFYQRPLRSQKSSISNCALEFRKYIDSNGAEQSRYLKAIPKSNPLYQEFRLWQWIHNLYIYRREDDRNVTLEFLGSIGDCENLFTFLNNRKEIEQKPLIKYLLEQKGLKGKVLTMELDKYRWNYVEDKKYPCNETNSLIRSRLERVEGLSEEFLTPEIEQHLWHIIYSVTDKIEYEKALRTFASQYQIDQESFVEAFRKTPPFGSDYGSFSEKAIKKLLSLMRLGKYWSWQDIDTQSRTRIEKILCGEYDETIKNQIREKALHLTSESHFQGLQLWLAQYIVYDRPPKGDKWSSADDLEEYLREFKQHSLRNPIVEQVVTETLRVVKDIWTTYGYGAKDFFSEIHIELGREMKNTAEERKRLTGIVTENENTNLRIKALLVEMMQDKNVENVRPYSPSQQEILKVYEDGVLSSDMGIEDDILKISKTAQPSSADLKKYKLWLEQRYISPYTGQIIPLNKLFTAEYEIEHIIPQSRYFDDSFNNKVICESAINKLKDNRLGLEFVKACHGQIVECGFGRKVNVLEVDQYEALVKQYYARNRTKRNRLLMDEIPEKMIERQLNDTRYISKFIAGMLSNIVRADTGDEGVNSKNVLPGNGKITSQLKQDWGLNDIWNELVLPRFERLNQVVGTSHFTSWNEKNQKFLPSVPLEFSKGFSKKRIDHRHHALDALVIACATRNHINLLHNRHAGSKERHDLNRKLRVYEKVSYTDPKSGERIEREIPKDFIKPWVDFTTDARDVLEKIVVSFKQNLRIINKATNRYEKWAEKDDGAKVKELHKQEGVSWAIRKSLHKDTVSGLVKLRKKKIVSLSVALDNYQNISDKEFRRHILMLVSQNYDKKMLSKYFKDRQNKWNGQDMSKLEICYWENDNVASRVNLGDMFDEKRIETVTDSGIRRILFAHLDNYRDRLDEKGRETPPHLLAFSPEGIEEMNKNIVKLNNGKSHQPILKVRTYEPKGNKFTVGQKGNKKAKFVEAAKGTNLFFAIYQNENGKRNYETIPLNEAIDYQKHIGVNPLVGKDQLSKIPIRKDNGKFLFYLSPNDLVYVPVENEYESIGSINFDALNKEQVKNIYKVVSFTGNQIFFVRHDVATSIVNKAEFSSLNKMERAINGKMIKETCLKIIVDRIGRVTSIGL